MVKEYSKLLVSLREANSDLESVGVDGKMDGAKFKENFMEANFGDAKT